MRTSAPCFSALLLAIAGCGEGEPVSFRLEVPLDPTTSSVILAIENGPEPTLHAAAADALGPLVETFPLDAPLGVNALLYDETLAQLDLSAGPLALAMPGAPLARAVPSPSRTVRAEIVDRNVREWSELPELPTSIADLQIADDDPCGSFAVEVIDLEVDALITALASLPDGRLLAATDDRQLFVVTSTGGFFSRPTPSDVLDIFVLDDGTTYLGGEGGILYEAAIEATEVSYTVTATANRRQQIIAIDGDRTPGGELYLLMGNEDETGYLERYDPQMGTVETLFNKRFPIDVARTGPRDVAFAWGYEQKVAGWRDGNLYEAIVPTDFSGVESMEFVEGLGLVVGLEHGLIFVQESETDWKRITLEATRPAVRITAYPEGFFFMFQESLGQWIDNQVCPLLVGPAEGPRTFARELVSVGSDVVTVAESEAKLVRFNAL